MLRLINTTSSSLYAKLILSVLMLLGLSSAVLANEPPTVATPALIDLGGDYSQYYYDPTSGQAVLSVLGADDNGESNLTYTWSTTGTLPGPVYFDQNSTNSAKNTIVNFTQTGTYNFLVTIQDAEGLTVTSSVSITLDQYASWIDVEPNPTSLDLGFSQVFTAVEMDQFSNPMGVQPTWDWSATFGSIDSTGNYTAILTGVDTIVASDDASGVHGIATVTAGYPPDGPTDTTITLSTDSPTVGIPVSLTGSSTGSGILSYSWYDDRYPNTPYWADFYPTLVFSPAVGASSSVTFPRPGWYWILLVVKDTYGQMDWRSIQVLVPYPVESNIAVSPLSATIGLNGTQQFTASVMGEDGNPLSWQPTLSWSATGSGSIDSNGLFTAGANAGTSTITATDDATSLSGTAMITVSPAPSVATPASASPNPVTGTNTALSVLGADNAGESTLTYTWATVGAPPAAVAFSANGTNAAKNITATFTQAGTYNFLVTITDTNSQSVTSSVAVTVDQTLTAITVSPSIVNLTYGTPQLFGSTASDQFGVALVSQPTVTWSTTNVLYGSMDQTGLYSAGYATYSDTAVATSGAVSGAASINVAASVLPLPDQVTGLSTYIYFYAGHPYIYLSWNYCNWAQTFDVYRGGAAGGESPTPIATGIQNGDSGDAYYDPNVTAGSTYYYTVAGLNTTGVGPSSSEVSVSVPAQPTAPTISLASVTDTQIVLNVTNPSTAVTNTVYFVNTDGSYTQVQSPATASPQVTLNNLYPSTQYTVVVTETDANGIESPLSNQVIAMTSAPPALGGDPTGLTVTSVTDTVAYFSWNPVTNADHYVVTCSLTSGGESSSYQNGSSTETTGAVGYLTANTAYFATVVAYSVDSVLASGPSNEISFITLLSPPTNLTASLQGTSVVLNWTAAPIATSYTILQQIGSGAQTSIGTTSTTTFTDTSAATVPPGTTITYVVQATTATNHDPGTASTYIVIPTNAPATLTAAGGPQQITLNWSASRLATSYNVYESPYIGGGQYGYTNVGSSSTTSFVVTGLSNNTQYFFVVKAVYANGMLSAPSPEATATTALAPPTNLVATSEDSAVGLTWNTVSGASGYNVYRMAWGNLIFTNISGGTPLTTTSFTDTSVVNGMGYFYVVTDISGNGESAYSNVAYAIPSTLEPGTATLQINSGGPAVGTWVADEYVVNLNQNIQSYRSLTTTDTIDISKVINPGPQAVYQTQDEGYNDFEYNIPGFTANAPYTVRLHFADWGQLPGTQVENITINGTQVATNYDYNAIAGGADRAVVAQFNANADSSGNIEIYFQGVTGYAHICGVEILSGSQVPTAPFNLFALPGNAKVVLTWTGYAGLTGYNVYRKTAGGGSYTLLTSSPVSAATYTDTSVTNGVGYYYVVTAVNTSGESRWSNQAYAMPEGVNASVYRINCGGPAVGLWSADEDYTGSNQIGSTTAPPILTGVPNPAPTSVYQSWHTIGSQGVTYTLPYFTPGSPYAVRLHFCDFSATPNVNILDASINGTAVLTNFDPVAEAGATGQVIVPQFNTTADANGDITIAMGGVLGNSYICGIEVLTDSLPPAQPQQLVAWRGNTQTTLVWQLVASATGYNVKRSLINGGPYTTVATGVSGATYSDATTTNYYYVVTAVNSTGEGSKSNEAYPAPPFTLSATPAALSTGIPGSGFTRITATATDGFSGILAYTGSAPPSGVTGQLYPKSSNLIAPFEIGAIDTTGTMLQLCVAAGTTTGTYPITITATSGDYSAGISVNLTVH